MHVGSEQQGSLGTRFQLASVSLQEGVPEGDGSGCWLPTSLVCQAEGGGVGVQRGVMRNGNVTWRDLGTWLTRRLRAANTPQGTAEVCGAQCWGTRRREGRKTEFSSLKIRQGDVYAAAGPSVREDVVEMSLRCSFGTGGPCTSSSPV